MTETSSKITDSDSTEENADESLLSEIRSRLELAQKASKDLKNAFKEDVKFSSGEQWDEAIKNDRAIDGRPCLVVNKLNQSVNQVTNEQRQNRPAIRISPVDDAGDIETAKVIQGLIRNIEQCSNADAAYDTAFEYSTRGGFGFWRIITEYSSPTSFNVDLRIKRIRDPLTVDFDPNSVEADGSDAEYAFVHETISHDEYKRLYKDSQLAKAEKNEFKALQDQAPDFITENSCLVTEYFYKEYEEKTICLLSNGSVVFEDKLEEEIAKYAQSGVQVEKVKYRTALVPKIKWVKTNGVEILSRTDFPGIYIPVVPAYGAELIVDGKLVLKGIVRDAKDSARMYNYWKSAETEAIALAPRAPFIAAVGQIEGFEDIWKTANRKNYAYLPYNPKSVDGTVLPAPQRQPFEPAIGAITQALMGAADDIKATTGIYDAAMGARSNETSGVAIARRTNQAQTSNYHLVDNLSRSIQQTGKILVYALPEVYDTARAARIIGEDGTERMVKLNEAFDENGKKVIYSLEAGKYDVTVDTGPSYQTKRQEAVGSMLELSRSIPQTMQAGADIIVKNMDFHGSQELAERLKKTLPPNLLDEPNQQNQVPPQVQQKLQQQGQMIEQLTGTLKKLQDEKEQKLIEIESKERIEMAKLKNTATIELAKLESKEAVELLGHQMNELKQRLDLLDMSAPFDQDPQNFAQKPINGGPSAGFDQEAMQPTGGQSPGSPMEGQNP